MEIPKLIILLCCTYLCFASEHGHSHTIPVEGYETELQNLGQHVEIPETPVKVVKITKTIAVKIPVPYPVKVIQKVPYPVQVAKPYPVPVPQIIKVPHIVTPHQGHEAVGADHAGGGQQFGGGHGGGSYQVQEPHSFEAPANEGHSSFVPLEENQSYYGGNGRGDHVEEISDEHSFDGSAGNAYNAPSSHYGDNEDNGSFESRSYDQAISQYLSKFQPSINNVGSGGYH